MTSITSLVNSSNAGVDFTAYLDYISVLHRPIQPRPPTVCIDVTGEEDSVILDEVNHQPPMKKQKIVRQPLQEKRAVVVNPKPRIQLISVTEIDKAATKSLRKKFRSQAKCIGSIQSLPDSPKNKKVLTRDETIKGCVAGVRDLVGKHTFGLEGFTLKCRQGMLAGGFLVTLTSR